MRKIFIIFISLFLGLIASSGVSFARDSVADYSIQEAMSLEVAKEKLGDDIRFFFGSQSPGKVSKNFGEFATNKKTNAFNKTDTAACQRAFLSAMISLRDRARREGGNAVIEIKSNYKSNRTSSNTTFQCGAGGVVAGVALVGTVVKL
jgi:uncharacterized protein YbjQ (UPF0145 family)